MGKPVEAVFCTDETEVELEYRVPFALWLGRLVPCEAWVLDRPAEEVVF